MPPRQYDFLVDDALAAVGCDGVPQDKRLCQRDMLPDQIEQARLYILSILVIMGWQWA